ncbi:hypothetical protein B0H13DRAFT_2301800 [Mycena leptocephala]|nr:hypothetical protein B0H13DRAFT_2301800 [Mycena leptocephala]
MKTRQQIYASPPPALAMPVDRTKPKKYPILAPPFRFKGEHLAFLQSYIASFVMRPPGSHREFWVALFKEYWHTFPWRLAIDVDPHEGMNIDEPSTHAECDLKVVTFLTTEPRIKGYFYHMRWLLKHRPQQS